MWTLPCDKLDFIKKIREEDGMDNEREDVFFSYMENSHFVAIDLEATIRHVCDFLDGKVEAWFREDSVHDFFELVEEVNKEIDKKGNKKTYIGDKKEEEKN